MSAFTPLNLLRRLVDLVTPRVLDRYIFTRFLSTFVFMVLMLIVVVVVIDFAEKLDDFLEEKPPLSELFVDYYFNLVLFYANLFSPVCVFLACIFFTSRMTQNSETTVILSSGVSFYRLLMPYLAAGILLSAGSFYLTAWVVPPAVDQRMEFEYTYVQHRPHITGRNLHRRLGEGSYLYLWNYNQVKQEGFKVVLEHFEGTQLKAKVSAERMAWNDSLQTWTLEMGLIRRVGESRSRLERFDKMDTTFNLRPSELVREENYAESIPYDELLLFIERERERGSEFLRELELERHERLAYPFASLVLTLVGVALSTRKRRGGIAFQLGIGFILTFVYLIVLSVSTASVGDNYPVALAVWTPNAVFGLIALLLIRWAPK